jgi:uncharacterized membrane protein (UPF0127 family)
MKERRMKKALLLTTVVMMLYCAGQAGRTKYIKVFFPDGYSVAAELAVTDEERQQGLMFREKIAEDQGMLFIFEEEEIHSFWMKNMRFSIDILWLDRERRIVHLESRVPPCTVDPCPSYPPDRPASFVLELQSGAAEKHGLKLYDRLDFILPKGPAAAESSPGRF